MAALIIGIVGLVVSIAGTVTNAVLSEQSQAKMNEEAAKNEVRAKSAKERELNLANSQVRRTALLAGKSMVELINAKRRSTIVSRRAYEAKGNPVESGGSSGRGTAVTSKVGAASVAPAGVQIHS